MSEVAKLQRQVEKLIADGAADGKILSIVVRILAIQPDNYEMLRMKVVCLIHMEKFGSALNALNELNMLSAPTLLSDRFMVQFYKAYCYYRMQQFNEAKDTLEELSELLTSHTPSRHLMAQICFALEEYKIAAVYYGALVSEYVAHHANKEGAEYNNLITNYVAALSLCDATNAINVAETNGIEVSSTNMNVTRKKNNMTYNLSDNVNVLFNVACAQLELHDYRNAISTLYRAEELCARHHQKSAIHSLADILQHDGTNINEEALCKIGVTNMCELNSNVIQKQEHAFAADESLERCFFNMVAHIWLQISYTYYFMDQKAKSRTILEVILRAKPTSQLTLALASINWAVFTSHANFFEAHHRLRLAQSGKVAKLLTSRQRLIVMYNTALLFFNSGSIVNCKHVMEQLSKEYPLNELTQSLRLALAVREVKKKRTNVSTLSNNENNDNNTSDTNVKSVYSKEITKKISPSTSPATMTIASEADTIMEYIEEFKKNMESIKKGNTINTVDQKKLIYMENKTKWTEDNMNDDDDIECKQFVNLYGSNVNGECDLNFKVKMQLITAQVYLNHGDPNRAIASLSQPLISFLSSLPSVLPTLTAWRLQNVNLSLVEALKPFKHALIGNNFTIPIIKTHLLWLIQYFVNSHTDNISSVVSLIDDVCNAHPELQNDNLIAAMLVLHLSEKNSEMAKTYFAQLDNIAQKREQRQTHHLNAKDRTGPTRAQMEMLGYKRDYTESNANGGKKLEKDVNNHTNNLQSAKHSRRRPMRRPPKSGTEGRPDPERWLPMSVRSYIKDLPDRRKKELKRLRALKQDELRRAAKKRQNDNKEE